MVVLPLALAPALVLSQTTPLALTLVVPLVVPLAVLVVLLLLHRLFGVLAALRRLQWKIYLN